MADVTDVLEANRAAVEGIITAAEAADANWTTPRAPGKWSPQQVVEHVAISLDEAAKLVSGSPSHFPTLPFFLRPIFRTLILKRTIKKGVFPSAKTFKEFEPEAGPDSPAAARARLEPALARFEEACRSCAEGDGTVWSGVFGTVPLGDYARFNEMHIRHHIGQIPRA